MRAGASRRFAASCVAGVIALTLAGAALGAAPTKVERWVAASKGIHILERASGACSAGSRVDARADAWLCTSGSVTYDPCFEAGPSVVCPNGTPGSRDAVELRMTKPLPRGKANSSAAPTSAAPWVIVTAAGANCYRQPTTTFVAGKPVRYVCAGSALLAGVPNRADATWTIDLLPTVASKRYVVTAIAAAWW